MTDADADFFFGREPLTADILERLRRGERMFTLVGNSGVGKSSVVQAGVVAALRRQLWPGVRGRGWPGDLKDSRSWLVLTMKPARAPLFELARAFVAQWTEPTDPARERLAGEWAKNLQDALGLAGAAAGDQRPVPRALRAARARPLRPRRRSGGGALHPRRRGGGAPDHAHLPLGPALRPGAREAGCRSPPTSLAPIRRHCAGASFAYKIDSFFV